MQSYHIIRVHKRQECADCGRTIPKGTLAVKDYALDYSKSFEGKKYVAYWLPACYRAGLSQPEQTEFDNKMTEAKP